MRLSRRASEDVARQHGIILSKDDPLRLLEAYCMEVLKNGLKEQQAALLEEFSQNLAIEHYKWSAEMEQRNKRMVDKILEESRKQLLKQLQSGTTAFFTAAEESLAPLLEEIRSRDRKNTQMVLANLIAAVLVFLAALLVVLV